MRHRITQRRSWAAVVAALLLLPLAGCASDGSLYIPYYSSAAKKLQFQPSVVEDHSKLAVGRNPVAIRLVGADGQPIADARVKVRFLRMIGLTAELGEDLWAQWVPGAEPGDGVYVVEPELFRTGYWRADVLAMTAEGKRGEAQVYFEVPS